MKKTLLICLTGGALSGLGAPVYGQTPAPLPPKPTDVAVEDAQEKQFSRFSQEVFSRYIQAAYDRDLLTRDGSTYTVKSSLFGLKSLGDQDFDELSTVKGSKFSRHFAVELGAKAGEQFKLSDGVVGFTWAVIDRRDILYNFRSLETELQQQAQYITAEVNKKAAFDAEVANIRTKDPARADALVAKLREAQDPLKNKTPAARQKAVAAVYEESGVDYKSVYNIDDLKKGMKNRGLLTFYGTGYTDFKDATPTQAELGMRYVGGFGSQKANPFLLDVQAYYAWRGDTVTAERDLDRQVAVTKIGVNKVVISGQDEDKPLVELKFNGGNEYRFGTRYSDEKTWTPYGEAVLRIRLSEQIWVPLTLKYDVKDATAFGFLKVVWNLSPGDAKK
jgi:hypothetical protein